jgi:hypothetical protein
MPLLTLEGHPLNMKVNAQFTIKRIEDDSSTYQPLPRGGQRTGMGTAEVNDGLSVRSNYIKRAADLFDPVQ